MARQKVKGTGHKQPSDASSEPNFYSMPPVEPEFPAGSTFGARYKPTILPPLQPPPAAALPGAEGGTITVQDTASLANTGIDPNSPGFSSLHGAAQLLHGISAGGRSGAFLGPSATSAVGGSNTAAAGTSGTKPASFLQPHQLRDTDEYTNIQGV